MKLDFTQIQSITLGAERICQTTEGIAFYRFTQEQEDLYKLRSADFYKKTFASSGVKLRFRTDSPSLTLDITVSDGSSRSYFAVDLLINGRYADCLSNFGGEELEGDYTTGKYERGDFSKTFSLGEGEKEVCLHLPWSLRTVLRGLYLADGASVSPVKPRCKMICYGDSITHGYDALHPSRKYTARLAELLDAEEINKAIGGDKFFPELAASQESFAPDIITVAYGTNDWRHHTRELFEGNCRSFYRNLREKYPRAKIYAITPIWRKDMALESAVAEFTQMEALIRELTADIPDIQVLPGFGLVPQEAEFFGDLRLHPNDRGFDAYYEGLARMIK